MKVILLQNVRGLGSTGQTVNVKDGFARNFLMPRKLAVAATASSARQLEHQKRMIEGRLLQEKKKAQLDAEKLASYSCTISRMVGEEDKLFGSVTTRDIAQALQAEGFDVEHTQVVLEEPIKQLGVYHVAVKLPQAVEAKVKVWVVSK
jgi:large subunit ribosomal protein L9